MFNSDLLFTTMRDAAITPFSLFQPEALLPIEFDHIVLLISINVSFMYMSCYKRTGPFIYIIIYEHIHKAKPRILLV